MMSANVMSSSFTHVGNIRRRNEDRLLVRDGIGLYCVCDGMGGHPGGDIAAATAIDAVTQFFLDLPLPGLLDERAEFLREAVEYANQRVWEKSLVTPGLNGMGTTLAALWTVPSHKHVILAHVGDSRIYLVREDKASKITLYSLTEDHELGGRLTHVVGVDAHVKVSISTFETQPNDIYLVCSDGLYREVDATQIMRLLSSAHGTQQVGVASLENVSARLLATALQNGGHDNVSGVVVRLS